MTNLVNLDISNFKQKYNLKWFVETGSWYGDGIQQALNVGFEVVMSCDINKQFYDHCRNRFLNNKSVHLYHLPSDEFLTLTQLIGIPSLFWLDAHFPVDYGGSQDDEKYRLPLIRELEILRDNWDISKSVIICDDIRNFRNVLNPRFRNGELADRFIIDVDWDYFTHILDKTHNLEINEHYDGIAYFLPKDL